MGPWAVSQSTARDLPEMPTFLCISVWGSSPRIGGSLQQQLALSQQPPAISLLNFALRALCLARYTSLGGNVNACYKHLLLSSGPSFHFAFC